MADITIRVRNRIAEAVGNPEIICGNDGYNVVFDFDEEWSAQEIKTMRVAWTDTFSGNPRHIDVPFFTGSAAIPAIADAYEVQIGVYTGSIMTTTPARIPCARCITDGGTYHEDPEPETYTALLQLLRDIRSFKGRLTINNPYFDLDLTRDELVFNQQSAHSGGYQISPATIFHYNGAWEWCITYRKRFSTSITSGESVCLIGSTYGYYENPTIEILYDGTAVWFGVSNDRSSWTGSVYTYTGGTGKDKLKEQLEVGNEYSFIIGVDEEQCYYTKVVKTNTGETLVDYRYDTYDIRRTQHNNPSDTKVCLLCNSANSRFYLNGDVILSKTYYKENGNVLWGNKAYAITGGDVT